MLKIKLARFGKTHQPHYRIVVNEAKDKRDGKYVANLGYYIPTETPKVIKLDLAEYDAWKKKGAQPTQTVAAIAERLRSGKLLTPKSTLSKKAKAKQAAASAAEAAPVAPVETPVQEEAAAA